MILTASLQTLLWCLAAVLIAVSIGFFFFQRKGWHDHLQLLANEYGGKVSRDPYYFRNYVCLLRYDGREYCVTYRPIPGHGSDGGDLLLMVCKMAIPFEFIITSDRTHWRYRIGEPPYNEWPRVHIQGVDSYLNVRTPAEKLVSGWLHHQVVYEAIVRLMDEMDEIVAKKDELQVTRYLDYRGDVNVAMIKTWISQIDFIANSSK